MFLGLAALVLGKDVDPRVLGSHVVPCLIVILVHSWSIAVAERSCSDRGGGKAPRFPLGPRLVTGGSGLARQLALPLLLLALGARDPVLAVSGLAVLVVLSTESLRRMLPFVLPAAVAVYSVAAMDEFHTLGDLADSAETWTLAVLSIALGSVVVAGPLLRTDMGGRLSRRGRIACLLAGIPGLVLGLFLAGGMPFIGSAPPDVLALAAGLLAGGVLQSAVAGFFARSGGFEMRETRDYPWIVASDVGKAVSTLYLPALALILFAWVRQPAAWDAIASPSAWIGLSGLLMIVPAVFCAIAFGWSLDRADGRRVSLGAPILAGAGLAGWIVFGPALLPGLLGQGGLVDQLAAAWPMVPRPELLPVAGGGMSLLTPGLPGSDVTMHGVPVADLLRTLALMLGACTLLASRTLRHTRPEYEGARWTVPAAGAVLTGLLAWLITPRLGPLGIPLGCALACFVMTVVDALQVHGLLEPEDDEDEVEEGASGEALVDPV